MRKATDLPTRVIWKTGYLHPVWSATWPRSSALVAGTSGGGFTVPRAPGELDGESLAHEFRSVFFLVARVLVTGNASLLVQGGEGPRMVQDIRKATRQPDVSIVSNHDPFKRLQEQSLWSLTGHDISRIHGILVLDESEAIHELDLGDLAGAMCSKVRLDVGFRRCTASHRLANIPFPMALAQPRSLVRPSCAQLGPRKRAHHCGAGCPDRGEWPRPRSSC